MSHTIIHVQDVKDERAAKIAELKEKQAELEVVHRDLDAASSELLTVEAYDGMSCTLSLFAT